MFRHNHWTKAALAAALLMAPTPALASDFSFLAYYLLAAYCIAALIFVGLVWGLTHFIRARKARSVIRAIVTAVAFTPAISLTSLIPAAFVPFLLITVDMMGDGSMTGPPLMEALGFAVINSVAIAGVAYLLYRWQMRKEKGGDIQ